MNIYMNDIPPVMTRKEAQEILKISKNTILELLQNGYLDSFKIKGRYRITREALIEFITKSIYYC